jgi:hypothetical protein
VSPLRSLVLGAALGASLGIPFGLLQDKLLELMPEEQRGARLRRQQQTEAVIAGTGVVPACLSACLGLCLPAGQRAAPAPACSQSKQLLACTCCQTPRLPRTASDRRPHHARACLQWSRSVCVRLLPTGPTTSPLLSFTSWRPA